MFKLELNNLTVTEQAKALIEAGKNPEALKSIMQAIAKTRRTIEAGFPAARYEPRDNGMVAQISPNGMTTYLYSFCLGETNVIKPNGMTTTYANSGMSELSTTEFN